MQQGISIYDSVADFIASLGPQQVLDLRPAPQMQDRLAVLLTQEKEGGLAHEEKDELDHYLVLERLIRLAKAHARLKLKQGK